MFSFVYTLFTNRAKMIKYEIIYLNHLQKNNFVPHLS